MIGGNLMRLLIEVGKLAHQSVTRRM